jgi:hypothetical protein
MERRALPGAREASFANPAFRIETDTKCIHSDTDRDSFPSNSPHDFRMLKTVSQQGRSERGPKA